MVVAVTRDRQSGHRLSFKNPAEAKFLRASFRKNAGPDISMPACWQMPMPDEPDVNPRAGAAPGKIFPDITLAHADYRVPTPPRVAAVQHGPESRIGAG